MAALVSSGGLYALVDSSDAGHEAAVAALGHTGGALVALAPVVTEAVRLTERLLGNEAGERLLEAVSSGQLLFQPVEQRDWEAARRIRREEAGISLTGALVLAAAVRLGVEAVLCREPPMVAAARRRGLHTLLEE